MWVIIIKKYRSYEMGVKKLYKRALIGAVCSLGFAFAGTAGAVDWLMLQGTEPQDASAPVKVWGFVQGTFWKDYSSANAGGAFVPPKLLGPNLNAQSGFNISHAQIGVRGTAFPIDDHINYMLLLEAGNAATARTCGGTTTTGTGPTAITTGGDCANKTALTDASITLNYVKGARVRVGMFKHPGAEEGMQSLGATTYIDFSEATNSLLLERFPNAIFTPNLSPQTQAEFQSTGGSLNGFTGPVGGFRDMGVQLFDTFDMGKDWNLSYAAMVGQGSGIQFGNVDGEYDTYLYLSTEKNLASTGPANGLKFFVWSQTGKRLADVTNDGAANPLLYKRDRSGLGVKYMAKPFRATFEYISADGMIFEGPDKPSFYFAVPAGAAFLQYNGVTQKANGWYLDGGWYIPGTKWELDARYDTTDFNTGSVADEHKFTKTTLGVQYNYNPRTRVTLNYELRDFKCTAPGVTTPVGNSCANANKNLSGVGNKVVVAVTQAF
jgi:hypothetical protein